MSLIVPVWKENCKKNLMIHILDSIEYYMIQLKKKAMSFFLKKKRIVCFYRPNILSVLYVYLTMILMYFRKSLREISKGSDSNMRRRKEEPGRQRNNEKSR